MKVTGIYKIISPSGNIYIGQSVDIKDRWRRYKRRGAYSQHALQRSFDKYGVNYHLFEILHQLPSDVDKAIINIYECLYIELYKSAGYNLLNIKEGGGGGGKMPDEVKNKIGKANKGKKPTQACISASVKAHKGISSWNKGKRYKQNLTIEQRLLKSINTKRRHDSKKPKCNTLFDF